MSRKQMEGKIFTEIANPAGKDVLAFSSSPLVSLSDSML